MFLYKRLRFEYEDEITSQLLEIVKEQNSELVISKAFDINLIKDKVPKLYEQFLDQNIQIEIFREFVSQPNAGLGIHKDGTQEFPKYLALNWPVENCEGTRMLWWELNKDAQVAIDTVDVAFKSYNSLKFYSEVDATKIGEFEITKPTLVNVGAYHSVVNGPKIRRMVSFRFKPEPLHLL
jgi:hypothetical protein